MKIIVGLGNPGTQYEDTRHNIGFKIIDELAKKLELPEWKQSTKFNCLFVEQGEGEDKLLLVKPLTFMNLSGNTVGKLITFYKPDPSQDMLVCYDDKDMLFGKLRERLEGSSGGHNGIKSIISSIGTDQFHRLKFGIGHEGQAIPTDAFVLQKFTEEEQERLPKLIGEAVQNIQKWIAKGG